METAPQIKKSKHVFAKVLLFIVSLSLSWWLFEYFGSKILENRIGKEYYADVDHHPKPNQKGFNADGIRTYKNAPLSSFTEDTYNIIFLGDSFTMGLLAEKGTGEVAFPFQVNRMMKERGITPEPLVANFGWTSSSPLLDYRRLVSIGRKYKPKLVVLCLDISDFYDDISYKYLLNESNIFSPSRYMMQNLALTSYWMNIKNKLGYGLDLPDQQYFIVNQPLEKSERYLTEIENNINNIHKFCTEELNVPFILIMLPRGIQYNKNESPKDITAVNGFYKPLGPYVLEPIKWLERYKKKVSFPVFSLLEDFRNSKIFPTCFHNDPHYNRKGHRVAAEAIFQIIHRLSADGSIGLKFPNTNFAQKHPE
jgi:hypothetical protein